MLVKFKKDKNGTQTLVNMDNVNYIAPQGDNHCHFVMIGDYEGVVVRGSLKGVEHTVREAFYEHERMKRLV